MRSWIVGIVAVSLLGMNACWGHKPHRPHHHDRPDGSVPKGPDSCSSDTSDTVDVVSCQQIEDLYLEEGALPSGACAEGQPGCDVGLECCCGACAPNLVCQCSEGTWGCYFTDFCMRGSCGEGGVSAPDAG